METEKIKELLDRYFEGNCSLPEEQMLKDYFCSDQLAEELLPYQPLFDGLAGLTKETESMLGDELSGAIDSAIEEDLMDYILESEHKEKNKLRYLWQAVSAVAAILLITLLVFNFQDDKASWEDTYSDPNVAYIEANKTLQLVAQKYQLGLAQLHPVGKLNKAVSPLDKGLKSVNKGFQEMENLQLIHEKLKNQ